MPRPPNASVEEIIAETLRLIAEHDVSGVTIDMVAENMGVSKATIYRRWPSRADLLLNALTFVSMPDVRPDTGSLHTDLAILLGELVQLLDEPATVRVFAAIINASIRDAQLEKLRRITTARARLEYEHVIARAITRGELRADADISRLIDLLIAPFISRSLIDHMTVDRADIGPIIDIVLASSLEVTSPGGEGLPVGRDTDAAIRAPD